MTNETRIIDHDCNVKHCPKCSNKMTRIYEGQTRLVLNRLVVLPGPLRGYKCEKCEHEEDVCRGDMGGNI